MFDKLQADAEAEAEAAAAGGAAEQEAASGSSVVGGASEPPPLVDPAKTSAVDVPVSGDAMQDGDSDIGEPLGEPQAFEPRDVHIGNATGGA